MQHDFVIGTEEIDNLLIFAKKLFYEINYHLGIFLY